MKNKACSLSRRAAALFLALTLSLPTVYASAGERKLQTSTRIVDGLTYTNTVTLNGSNRVESFALELSPDSAVTPILVQGSGTVYGGGNIKKAISAAQEMGYHVLGGINTDFFNMSNGIPLGIVIENGVYCSSPEEEAAMLVADGQISLCETPQVDLSLTNWRTGAVTAVQHLNKYRIGGGGLYLLTRNFSTVSTRATDPGWYVRLRPVSGSEWDLSGGESPVLTVNCTLELEVAELLRSSEPTTIGENEYILTAADESGFEEVFQSFQEGDRVTLTTFCQDPALSAAQWAGGVGDVMIRDGAVTDSSGWTYRSDGRNPRSAMGVKEDGTVVFYAVDGRQTGYSAGLSQLDLADELLSQGCRWAVNLDGGGSTSLSAWLPGQSGPAVKNSPSGGSLRACATYLLLVTPEKGDSRPARLAWKEDGLTVLAGSGVPLPETVVLDSGLNPLPEIQPTDLSYFPEQGSVHDGVYTAGSQVGTDTVRFCSPSLGIEGEAKIHVVDTLTELTVTRAGEKEPLTELRLKPGETVQLAAAGSYWGREALRDLPAVSWKVEGFVGTVDETGTFTAVAGGTSGSVQVSAGGLTCSIPVTLVNIHTDVTPEHWAWEAVEYCYDHGIVNGISATEFGRDNLIARADFILMLHRALGAPAAAAPCTFTDVADTAYYYDALSWAQGAGLISGTGDGGYAPGVPITREQAFTVLCRCLPLLGKDCPDAGLTVLDQFTDKDLVADYAKSPTATLVAQGIVNGRGTEIQPQGQLTRAEVAAVLYRALTYTPNPDVPVDPQEPQQPEDPQQPQDPQEPQQPQNVRLTLSQSQVELKSAESLILTAALEPAQEGAAVLWTSSDPTAAVVTPGGTVTNLSPRSEPVDVTVTASWNGLSAVCTVRCQPSRWVGMVINVEDGLRIRSGPSTGHDRVGLLQAGERVVVLGEQEGWYQILYRNDQNQAALGYVSGDYLTMSP